MELLVVVEMVEVVAKDRVMVNWGVVFEDRVVVVVGGPSRGNLRLRTYLETPSWSEWFYWESTSRTRSTTCRPGNLGK